MKKILIGFLLALLPILGFSQYPQLLQNGEQMGTIRLKLNNDLTEAWRLFDLINTDITAIGLRTTTLEASSHTHSNMAILSGTTASFTIGINTIINGHTTSINLLNGRVTVLENAGSGGGGGTGDVKVNGTPHTYDIPYFNGNDTTITGGGLVYRNGFLGVGLLNPLVIGHFDAGTATATYLKVTQGTSTGQLTTDGFDFGLDAVSKAWIRNNESTDLGISQNGSEAITINSSYIDIKRDVRWPNVTPVGTFAYPYVASDHIQRWDSSYILGSKVLDEGLIPIKKLLKDKDKSGEIKWPLVVNDKVQWIYRTQESQFGKMLAFDQGMIEYNLLYVQDLYRKIEDLEDRLSVEAKYRESLEKRFNQLEKDVAILKHRSLKVKE
jgi:hypothetical protein